MFQMFQITTAMKCLSVISLVTLGSASHLLTEDCTDFFAGTCDLSQNNVVDTDMATNTPGECQVLKFNIVHEIGFDIVS